MMIKILFALATLMVLAGATRTAPSDRKLLDALHHKIQSKNKAFGDELRALLEDLRELMLTGDPENGIPILDPFKREVINVSTQIPDTADIKLDIMNLTVSGLSGFVVDNVDFNILRLRLDFDITVPSLKGEIDFYSLLAQIIDYPLFGEGDGSVEAVNFRFHGAAYLALRDGFLHMRDFDIVFELEAFKSNLSGLLGGGEVGEVINEIIQVLVPALLESQGEALSEFVGGFVMDFANQFLNELTLQDLIDLITGGGGGGGERLRY